MARFRNRKTVAAGEIVGAGRVTETTEVLHVYADGTSGDDGNNGRTALTPKKTLAGVFALLPALIKHNTAVHLSGVFSEESTVLSLMVASGPSSAKLIIDGGEDTTVVADDAGNPWAADIASTSSIGLSTLGWTPDEHAGYWVEILTGPAAGQTRLVHGNSATTVTPVRNFSVSPGVGAQFRIVRPATAITGTNKTLTLDIGAFAFPSTSVVSLQNLYIAGSQAINVVAVPRMQFAAIVNNSTAGAITRGGYGLATNVHFNSETFSTVASNTGKQVGYSQVHQNGSFTIQERGSNAWLNSFYAKKLYLIGCPDVYVANGSRIVQVFMQGCSKPANSALSANSFSNVTGYAATTIGGATGAGLTASDSVVVLGPGVVVSSCTTHGIECQHSRLHLNGAVAGTGNSGAGVYAHGGSVVYIKNGAPPTLTGTVGDFAVSNPAAQESTWAAIDAGTPVAVAAEMTMAKEVA